MKLQGVSMSFNNYTNFSNSNALKNTQHTNDDKKTNKQNGGGISLSQNSNYEKQIESIHEQIKKIQENDRYDADTKKSKIEELQKQLEEIEKAKTTQLSELLPHDKKNISSNNSNNSSKSKTNDSGVVLELSVDAKSILQADQSLKTLKSANSTKVKLEGEANVLVSEIKIDKGRGIDTANKEKTLARLKEGVEKSFEKMGDAVKYANDVSRDISDDSASTVVTNSENKNVTEVTANTSNDALAETILSEGSNSESKLG